jgi:hypothetical protein
MSAAEYLGVCHKSLCRWEKKCPWLNDQGIETRRLKGRFGRVLDYYSKDDLDRINAAKARHAPIPDVPGYTHVKIATAELACSDATLYRLMKDKGFRAKRVSGKGNDGTARLRWYVRTSFVANCKAERSNDPKPADRVTVNEAADILGVDSSTVFGLIYRGVLRGPFGRAVNKVGQFRMCRLLSREEVEARKTERAGRKLNQPTVARAGRAEPLAPHKTAPKHPTSDPAVTEAAFNGMQPRHTTTKFAANGAANHDHQKEQRQRPANEKYRMWKRWKDEGMSYGQIRLKHLEEHKEEVSEDHVKKGVKRARDREQVEGGQ